MKTLFVFFLFSLFSISSSTGSLVTPEEQEQKKIAAEKAAQEEQEFWVFTEEANDWSNIEDIMNRWEISFQLMEALLDAEESGDMICISLQPQIEDHNQALSFRLWFNDMTLGHWNWMNNIGRCAIIWHESHGRMIGKETHPRMYDVSIESIAEKFPELNHVNMSCRGSYGWLGDEEGKLSDANDPLYEKMMPQVSSILDPSKFTPSEYGIGNLKFSSPQGRWSYTEFSKFYNKYIVEEE